MSSLQDKIEAANIDVRRKLFDSQIVNMGLSTKAIRLRTTTDDMGDDNTEIIFNDEIDIVIAYHGEVPITRYRVGGSISDSAENQHLYLWEILPISLYTQWKDNVEKGDLIIHKIKNELNDYIKIPLMVTEVVGSFRSSLLWKRSDAALYNGILGEQIQKLIDNY